MPRLAWVTCWCLSIGFAARGEAPPYLVVDLEERPAGSNPCSTTEFRGRLYFAAAANDFDRELWVSDGTLEGTRPILFLRGAGPGGLYALAAAGDRLFFIGGDIEHGRELWVSDGEPTGTRMAADAVQGPGHSFPAGSGNPIFDPATIMPLGRNACVFVHDDMYDVTQLWVSDGSPSGTRLVADLEGKVDRGGCATLGEKIFLAYMARGGLSYREDLWVCEGVYGEPRLFKELAPADKSCWISSFAVANGKLFFFVFSGPGPVLWVSDGTAEGTRPVASAPSFVDEWKGIRAVADGVYFLGRNADGPMGLWHSDGVTATLLHVCEGEYFEGRLDLLGDAAGFFYFTDFDRDLREESLWVTNASPETAEKLRPVGNLEAWAAVGARFFYVDAESPQPRGSWLWVSDGSFTGTEPVLQFHRGGPYNPGFALTGLGRTLFISRSDAEHGWELRTFEGTFGADEVVLDVTPGSLGSRPRLRGAIGGRVLFEARERELWASDGTPEGTVKLVDRVRPNSRGELAELGGRVFFLGLRLEPSQGGLWVTDGTPEGTSFVLRTEPYFLSGEPHELVTFGDRLFFAGFANDTGVELWSSDGTAEGTRLFADLVPGKDGLRPEEIVVVGNRLFVTALPQGSESRLLWISDGTPEGTYALDRPRRCANSSTKVGGFIAMGERVFFSAEECGYGRELWITDGTQGGTRLVRDIYTGPRGGFGWSWGAVLFGDRLIFVAESPEYGMELWFSDGTKEGTQLFRDIWPGTGKSAPKNFVMLGGRALFSAADPEHGRELWITDGTREGTRLLADLLPGPAGSCPESLREIEGRVYFAAASRGRGAELWVTDGTREGTKFVWEIEPGPRGSEPKGFLRAGRKIFFAARGANSDYELWALPLEPRFVRGEIDGNGRVNLSDAIFLLGHLFRSGPEPSCLDAADVDDGGHLSLLDSVYLLYYLFRGGDEIPPPSGACGEDPTEDSLDCAEAPGCG